jgi:hypothetical protein
MADPRAMRDVWDGLTAAERAVAIALADAAMANAAPTVGELAATLGVAESQARETALRLYRMGLLAREGDDEPLPIGEAPRLIMPREMVLNVRRIQDEMAAGDLQRAPLRVLVELLDDAELENASRIWGLRTVPGVSRRRDLAARLLRLVADPRRVDRVVHGRGRDAAAIWKVIRSAPEPLSLAAAAAAAGLTAPDTMTVARRRAALAELEGALLVWHTYRPDGSRWLFVPAEIRTPGPVVVAAAPALIPVDVDATARSTWRHPDAVAWDLLTVLRIVTDANAPPWEVAESSPRWLTRIAGPRLWWGGRDGPPLGYVELLQAIGVAAGVLAIDEESRPHRVVAGSQGRTWRGRTFPAQTARLRDEWLRLPRWVEGEPAGLVEVWGADWRSLRPRLLAALADPDVGLTADDWVTLESLASRLAARYPTLLGASFIAATARSEEDDGIASDDDETRGRALSDVIVLELGGPFAWFGLVDVVDVPGKPRAVRLTARGAALAAREPLPEEDGAKNRMPGILVAASGEVMLRVATPSRVWALTAFAEPVDLGPDSHYRLTPGSVGTALASGVDLDQIVAYLERASGQPLPDALAANLATWAREVRRVRVARGYLLRCDETAESAALGQTLREIGWEVLPHGDRALLVTPGSGARSRATDDQLWLALRTAGYAPVLANPADGDVPLAGVAAPGSRKPPRES